MIDEAIIQIGQASLFTSKEYLEKQKQPSNNEQTFISKERSFRYCTANVIQIKTTLKNLVDRLSATLKWSDLKATSIMLRIRFQDLTIQTKQIKISQTAQNDIIIHHAQALFDQLFDGSLKVKQIGLSCSDFVCPSDSFQPISDTRLDLPLIHQVNDIRRRFGVDKIRKASCMRELIENASALAS